MLCGYVANPQLQRTVQQGLESPQPLPCLTHRKLAQLCLADVPLLGLFVLWPLH